MTPKMVLNGKGLAVAGFAAITVCLAAMPGIGTEGEAPRLTGSWLTALEFTGQRPFQTVITFSEADAAPTEQIGRGRWVRISAGKFSIAFIMSAADCDIDSGSRCRVSGTWTLNELGRLRGPLTAEVLDSTGRVVGSFRGVARARRIVTRGGP